jgi:hypothetical protein
MAVLVIGLTPISPVIEVVPVVDIPDFDRMTKLPADPRFTAAGPAALTACDTNRVNRTNPKRALSDILSDNISLWSI